MDQIKIGQYIADKRKSQGMTQEQLAEKVGRSRKAVSKWERGVCLPDVSVYTELCDILGITLNEFFAGEDIEPAEVAIQSEKNLLGVATDGSNRSGKLKKIVLLVTVIALVLAAILCWVMSREGYFLSNYIKPYDKESNEYRAATVLIMPGEASMFHYSVDMKFRRVSFSMYEYKGGDLVGEPQIMGMDFVDNGEPADGEGVFAVVNDYHKGSLSMIASTEYSKMKAETSAGVDIENFDEYGMTFSETDMIENIKPNKEYPLIAYYYGEGEISSTPVIESWLHYADNPSGSDYCVIITVKFETAETVGATVPDLTDMSIDDAKDMIENSDLTLGNIAYYDTTDDSEAIVYNQDPQPGSNVPQGTRVDIYLKKK